MIFKRLCAGVMALALTACSTYRGPLPDYSLVGEARQSEIEKFTLQEGFWKQGTNQYAMGPDERPYWLSSLKPVINDVSPRAAIRLKESKVWEYVGQAAILGALVVLISAVSDGDDRFFNSEQTLVYWSLLGISFGSSITRSIQMDRAAREYNQDLRAKFSPSVSLNINY